MAFRNRISKGGWKQLSTREEISSNTYALVHRKSPLSNFLEQRSRYDNGLPCYSTFEGEMVWRRYPLPSRVGLLSSFENCIGCNFRVFLDMARHLLPCPTRQPHLGCYLPRRRNPPGQIPLQKSALQGMHVKNSMFDAVFIRENWDGASKWEWKPMENSTPLLDCCSIHVSM